MSWIERSLPPEADDPPPAIATPPISEIRRLEVERAELQSKVRPRVHTARQVRIRERISRLTVEILKLQRN